MYNEDLTKKMIDKFGLEATIQWCKMQAYQYQLLSEVDVYSEETLQEMKYEHDWWNEKYNELIKNS
jgi:hypothetical protein